MIIIYSGIFNELASPWDEEKTIAKDLGFKVTIMDEETFKFSTNIDLDNETILYRGWMISIEKYAEMEDYFKKKGTI